jgi:phage gp46-like protein
MNTDDEAFTLRVANDGRIRITEDGGAQRITEKRAQLTIPTAQVVTKLPDVQTVWDPFGLAGDWLFAPPDLVTGRDLETAAIISLFTDRLANPDDPLPDPKDSDRRGWWADWQADYPIGSRLWLISREKQTEDVRQRVEEYCREALQWMLDDDVADTVDVTASWTGQAPGRLEVSVTVTRARAVLLERHFSWAWSQLFHITQGA